VCVCVCARAQEREKDGARRPAELYKVRGQAHSGSFGFPEVTIGKQ